MASNSLLYAFVAYFIKVGLIELDLCSNNPNLFIIYILTKTKQLLIVKQCGKLFN